MINGLIPFFFVLDTCIWMNVCVPILTELLEIKYRTEFQANDFSFSTFLVSVSIH